MRRQYKVIVDRPMSSSPICRFRDRLECQLMSGPLPSLISAMEVPTPPDRRPDRVRLPDGRLLDAAGVDCIWSVTRSERRSRLGDNLCVTIEQIIYHAEMVARAARRALVVADLPFLRYQVSPRQAIRSAGNSRRRTARREDSGGPKDRGHDQGHGRRGDPRDGSRWASPPIHPPTRLHIKFSGRLRNPR